MGVLITRNIARKQLKVAIRGRKKASWNKLEEVETDPRVYHISLFQISW